MMAYRDILAFTANVIYDHNPRFREMDQVKDRKVSTDYEEPASKEESKDLILFLRNGSPERASSELGEYVKRIAP